MNLKNLAKLNQQISAKRKKKIARNLPARNKNTRFPRCNNPNRTIKSIVTSVSSILKLNHLYETAFPFPPIAVAIAMIVPLHLDRFVPFRKAITSK